MCACCGPSNRYSTLPKLDGVVYDHALDAGFALEFIDAHLALRVQRLTVFVLAAVCSSRAARWAS